MLSAIREFFDRRIAADTSTPEHSLQLATAALLVEMARMDHEVDAEESRAITDAVRTKFGLSQEEADTLIGLAQEEAHAATDYHQFTSLINDHFSAEQKLRVIEYLWAVAFADRRLDMYEEHLVRKVAELLYVPHRDFIAAKLRARRAVGLEDT